MYCKKCYYCLENLREARVCPECGGGFDKGDVGSYLETPYNIESFLKHRSLTNRLMAYHILCFFLFFIVFNDVLFFIWAILYFSTLIGGFLCLIKSLVLKHEIRWFAFLWVVIASLGCAFILSLIAYLRGW